MGNGQGCCNGNPDAKQELQTGIEKGGKPGLEVTSPLHSPGKQEATVSPPAAAIADKYAIELDKTGGQPLGIDVDHADGATLLIVEINEGGLFAEWNATHKDKQVTPGDRIVEVNQAVGQVIDLVTESKKPQKLRIVLKRGA
mmetsp:Transcript_18791/g.40327  ORF Transcript_18791/g.40327 Transcript_18791/m.40327 type:complete len:142 (-) Transcript_18791:63-488(-)